MSPRRIVILAEATLDFHYGKTAISILRYQPDAVVAVIDSEHAGQTTDAVLGVGGRTPIVRDIQESLALQPTELLIGIAPRGGSLPPAWRAQILTAIENRMDIVSGLHYMLGDDPEFAAAAAAGDVRLHDVRRSPDDLSVAQMLPRRADARIVTFVGSDCAVGKMTAALEVEASARARGLQTEFVATGQTGIMLAGSGIAVDRVIGDFMAGSIEQLVVNAADRADWVFVEGQGSLLHPGYSGVTLALLHGSRPDYMVMVHTDGHDSIPDYPIRIPPLDRLVEIYQEAASWVAAAPVVATALNTRGLSDEQTAHCIADAEDLTGLPATDPVKFGGGKIVDALLAADRQTQVRGGRRSSRG